MRKYLTEFYTEKWDPRLNKWVQTVVKRFYTYAFTYDDACRYAVDKLQEFQRQEHNDKIAYWIDLYGENADSVTKRYDYGQE